jgi:hypothetical protein
MCGWNPQKLPSVTGTEASSCHLLGAYSAMFYVVAIEVTEASWAIEATEASWCHWYRSLLVTFAHSALFYVVIRDYLENTVFDAGMWSEASWCHWYRSFVVSYLSLVSRVSRILYAAKAFIHNLSSVQNCQLFPHYFQHVPRNLQRSIPQH